jgi:hypothetical protein
MQPAGNRMLFFSSSFKGDVYCKLRPMSMNGKLHFNLISLLEGIYALHRILLGAVNFSIKCKKGKPTDVDVCKSSCIAIVA